MTLVIVAFRGIMLHVPGKRKMTVLMPHTGKKHFGRTVEQHKATLVVPKWTSSDHVSIGWDTYELKGNVKLPSADAGGSADPTLPPEIARIRPADNGGKVKETVLTGLTKQVYRRVNLWAGSALPSAGKGHEFVFHGVKKRLDDHLLWQYETDDPVVIDTTKGKITVSQLDGVPFIVFGLFHMPVVHKATRSDKCTEARHFYALYSFYKDPEVHVPTHHANDCAECLRGVRPENASHAHESRKVRESPAIAVDISMVSPATILDLFPLSDPITCVEGGEG